VTNNSSKLLAVNDEEDQHYTFLLTGGWALPAPWASNTTYAAASASTAAESAWGIGWNASALFSYFGALKHRIFAADNACVKESHLQQTNQDCLP
jgi:hypothetical protein